MNTIYCIDDERVTLDWLRLNLRDMAEVCTFSDIETLKRAVDKRAPDLLITDVIMNGFSGYDVVKEVRAVADGIKIIMISALESDDFSRIAERHHCAWWQKGSGVGKLKLLVQEALSCH